jgi:hypothetical protein
MPCIIIKRSCERKKASSGEARRTIVHQADHTGMNTVKRLIPAKRDTTNQNIAGGKQHGPGKRTARSISAPLSDEEENFIQETPEAALIAAQAYLLTMQPEPGDLREHMHQAAIKSLELVEDELKQKSSEKMSMYYEHKGERW